MPTLVNWPRWLGLGEVNKHVPPMVGSWLGTQGISLAHVLKNQFSLSPIFYLTDWQRLGHRLLICFNRLAGLCTEDGGWCCWWPKNGHVPQR